MSVGPFGLRLASDRQSELRRLAALRPSPAPATRSGGGPPGVSGRRSALRRPVGHLLIRAGRWVAGPEERLAESRSGALASLS